MRAAKLIAEGAREFIASPHVESTWRGAEREQAEALLEYVVGRKPRPRHEIAAADERRFRRLVERRAGGEPVAQIVGSIEFRKLKLAVRKGDFVPRATSEFLALQAIRRLVRRRRPVFVDLATGIGPVALSVKSSVPNAEVHATDLSARAVSGARLNAGKLRLRINVHRGDLFKPLPARLRGKVDVMTIHPPYVPKHELKDLPVEVRGFEPRDALTDHSRDGLGIVQRVADEARDWLRPGGWLLIEVSPDMTRPIRSVLAQSGYRDFRSTKGELPFTRVLTARA